MLNIARNPTARQQAAQGEEAVARFVAEKTLDVLNKKSNSELDRAIADNRMLPATEDKNRNPQFVAPPLGPKIIPLSRGYKPALSIEGSSNDDPEGKMEAYRQHIAMMCGIPMIQLMGGLGSSKSGKSQSSSQGSGGQGAITGGSAELSGESFRPAIFKDRSEISACLEAMLDQLFHNVSNNELARLLSIVTPMRAVAERKKNNLLATLQEKYALVTNAAETVVATQQLRDTSEMMMALVTQFQQIADAAMEVSRLEYRFTIDFKKQKFLTDSEIEVLKTDGSISDYEAANMRRSRLGLPEIDEAVYNKNRATMLKRKKEEVDAEQPTPIEGAPPKRAK